MNKFFFLAFFLFSGLAQARWATRAEVLNFCSAQGFDADRRACLDLSNGKQFNVEALNFCSRQSFDTDKRKCLGKIADANYIDAAVAFCGRFNFDSDKLACMDVIKNNFYESAELDFCQKQSFESDKLKCLRQFGARPIPVPQEPPVCSNESARARLFQALRDLDLGDETHAREMIHRAIREL